MLVHDDLQAVLTAWMLILVGIVFLRSRNGVMGVGLVVAYLLNLWLLFWPASALYLLPWYHGTLRNFTASGTEQSLYGLAGFAFGSLLIAPRLLNTRMRLRGQTVHLSDLKLPTAYLITGVASYGLLSAFLGRIASLNSILSSGQELVVVGLSLCCWRAWRDGGMKKALPWLALSLTFPLITIVTRGYIGYGSVAALSVLIFMSSFARSKVSVAVAGVLLTYVALSVYVTYMRDRGEIRHSVWGGQAFSDRIDRVMLTASTFEWFDLHNVEHLKRIDDRVNQSYLTGAAVEHLKASRDFARGETIRDAFLAMIPRILWPEKTIKAGSGDLVSRFTGITFDKSTSVGIGQVMEFYVNFGTPGVVFGFMVFGAIITTLDILAAERLATGDLHGFVLFYLPGLSFLQVGGQLTEITASAAASLIVALMVNRILDRLQKKQAGERRPGQR
jgi:hypothetical protein